MDRFKQNIITTAIDGDPEESSRRKELARYVRRLSTTPTLVNCFRSALEEIEKRSQELLDKGKVAGFVDKGSDSGEALKLIDRLREAIAHYQVSEDRFAATSMAYT